MANPPSGEMLGVILNRLDEIRDRQTDILVQLNDGEHRFATLERRLNDMEERCVGHAKAERKRERDIATEPIARKVDLTPWLKWGALIGAVIAGALAGKGIGL